MARITRVPQCMAHTTRVLSAAFIALSVAACSSLGLPGPAGPGASPGATGGTGQAAVGAGAATQAEDLLQVSAACKAANLRPASPLPVSALSEAVLRQAKSGWVAVRYDVVNGRAQNARVVSSNPPGLYDEVVLRHARTYTEPTGANVQGCIMTTHIRF
jgi:hypothetical protein